MRRYNRFIAVHTALFYVYLSIRVFKVLFAITSWGKDAGNLKITKLASAILVKVIELLPTPKKWAYNNMAHSGQIDMQYSLGTPI